MNKYKAQTHFKDIPKHIISTLSLAKYSIKIASAWFSNREIINYLIANKNVIDLQIIISDNPENRKSKDLQRLISAGCKIMFSKRKKNGGFMHHKFCIVDNSIVITGSFNWSNGAVKNDENINVLFEDETALKYINEFSKLKKEASEHVIDSPIINHNENEISQDKDELKMKFESALLKIQNQIANNIKTQLIDETKLITEIDKDKISLIESKLKDYNKRFSKNDFNEPVNIYRKLQVEAFNNVIKENQEQIKRTQANGNSEKIMQKLKRHMDLTKARNVLCNKLGMTVLK